MLLDCILALDQSRFSQVATKMVCPLDTYRRFLFLLCGLRRNRFCVIVKKREHIRDTSVRDDCFLPEEMLVFHVGFATSILMPFVWPFFALDSAEGPGEEPELLPDILVSRDDNDDFDGESETLGRFADGEATELLSGACRFESTAILEAGCDEPSAILRAFTLAFQDDFTKSTLS